MDGSRNPVSDFDQALWWLIKNVPEPETKAVIGSRDKLPLVFQLVADTYWITDAQLRFHLKKLWGEFH